MLFFSCHGSIVLTLYLLVLSADNLCKQFGPRSGPTKCRAWSESKLFDTLMVFLKEFFKIIDFEKNQQTTQKHEKLPSMQKGNMAYHLRHQCLEQGSVEFPLSVYIWARRMEPVLNTSDLHTLLSWQPLLVDYSVLLETMKILKDTKRKWELLLK